MGPEDPSSQRYKAVTWLILIYEHGLNALGHLGCVCMSDAKAHDSGTGVQASGQECQQSGLHIFPTPDALDRNHMPFLVER